MRRPARRMRWGAARLAASLAAVAFGFSLAGCKESRSTAGPERRDGGVGEGPLFEAPSAVACLGSGRVLVADASYEAMLKEVDLETGKRTLVSSRRRGSGPYFAAPEALEVSADGRFAYVIAVRFTGTYAGHTGGAVVRIELSSGDRVIASGFEHGSGEELRKPVDMVLLDDERALVADEEVGLLQVSLVNGARAVLAHGPLDLRPGAGYPSSVSILSEDQAWIGTRVRDAVLGVTLATGESAVISSDRVGEGTSLGIPIALQWSEAWGGLLVLNSREGLMLIEPESGERTWLSGARQTPEEERGEGPPLSSPTDFCLDEERGEAILTEAMSNMLLAVERDSGDRRIVSY